MVRKDKSSRIKVLLRSKSTTMNFDIKEVFTAGMVLFAVIDIIGNIPLVISLRAKVGHIQSSPLHDGAIIIKENTITATRVVLPVSESTAIPSHFGLRHRAGAGISEKTDALVVVISEQRGKIVYIKDGQLETFSSGEKLKRTLSEDLSL